MTRQLLPIKGVGPLPTGERPRCNWCSKELIPHFSTNYEKVSDDNGFHHEATYRHFTGEYGYSDRFCGPFHAAYWAVKRAGVKR